MNGRAGISILLELREIPLDISGLGLARLAENVHKAPAKATAYPAGKG